MIPLAAVLLCFASVAAADSYYGAIHEVTVGGLKPDGTPNLNFYPNNIKANPGDKVRFTFNVKNHTVTQSSFDEPCAKLGSGWQDYYAGFDSGFNPVTPETPAAHLPTFEVIVNDTAPIWGYCQQVGANPYAPTHCQSGMVFGINAPDYGDKTFDAFLARAKASTTQDEDQSTYQPTATYNYHNAPPAQTHTVTVGGDPKTVGFVFTPSNTVANPGDTVTFKFMVKNHTVTQSSFDEPCRKIEATTWPPVYGFDSGFMPVAADAYTFPEFHIVVNDTKPIWGYCRQQAATFSHCGVGMVFSINADPHSPKSFEAFQQLAVHKNGTGVVDPFATAVPTAAPPAPTSALDGDFGNSKSALGDDADSDDDSSSALLRKLTNVYAPALAGLLVTGLVLLVALIAMAAVILRRVGRSKTSVLPTRSVSPSYQQVPLTLPHSTMADMAKYDYEEPKFQHYQDKN